MGARFLTIKKPKDIGLAVKRLVVFALPAVVLVGAIGANMAMSIFSPKPEEKEEVIKATPVVVAEAQAERVRLSVSAQGEARPRTQINLTSQVSGKINYVSPQFIEGGAFEEGDVLVRIEPAEFEFRVVQARANVAQARNRFASEEAEARIARKDWEELGQGEGSALALREPQMAEAEAALASARAILREAELQLERTTIRAPFKGRVQTQLANLGQFVRPGDNLGEIFSSDVMEVALPLTDSELGELGLTIGFRKDANNPGPDVVLTALVAGEPRIWRGRIAHTDSGYDRQTRVLFAYAEVDDPYGAGADNGAPLAAGLFVTAEIQGREIDNSVVVPRAALRGNDQVFVARDDDTLEIRKVAVASSDRNRAILIGGVEPGERVITSPVRGAADGIELAVAGSPASESTTLATATN
ncbi:MAG: efflux RND transporter periplasmic adaptor subunit [Pseudomonadota bacterium]